MSAAAFDALAPRYDELWTATPAGRAQRAAVWRELDPLFHPGDRILDLGCGTGEDAAHFAARGAIVHAIDPSPAMIAIARARGGFTTEVRDTPAPAPLYDGVISNFGPLNCVPDLAGAARAIAAVTRPGARVAICTIAPFCAWEFVYYAARLDFRRAFRRLRGDASFRGVPIHYPALREIRAAFAPYFELQRWSGIGMLVPPSYVRLPARLVALFALLDRPPFLRAIADHRLHILVRTRAC